MLLIVYPGYTETLSITTVEREEKSILDMESLDFICVIVAFKHRPSHS